MLDIGMGTQYGGGVEDPLVQQGEATLAEIEMEVFGRGGDRFDRFRPRNLEILLRWMEGASVPQLAERFGLDEQKVLYILKMKHIRKEGERLAKLSAQRRFGEKVALLAEQALDKVRDVMVGEETSELRFKAARDLLDRHPLFRVKDVAEGLGKGMGDAIIEKLAQLKYTKEAPRVVEGETI